MKTSSLSKSLLKAASGLVFAATLFLQIPAQAQFWTSVRGSGKIVSDTREVAEFTKIRIAGSSDAFVKVGGKREVRVEADDNIVENITTEVRDNELVIGMTRGSWSPTKMNVYITVPALKGVAVSGSGSIEVENGVQSETFKSVISGSGNIRFKGGKTAQHDVHIGGSGSVDANKLEAEAVSVQISGSGNSEVFAAKSLTASISGSGDVRYKGSPANVSKTIRGSGSVSAR